MNDNGQKQPPRKISLTRLADGHCPCITKAEGRYLAEAAAVCIDNRGHGITAPLVVTGAISATYHLRRLRVSDQMYRALADLTVATELGAVAIGIILVEELTEYQAVWRSPTSTGFDYWLATEVDPDLGFTARLETSGTLAGGENERKRRVRSKLKQTDRSDVTGLPALIVVTDFGDLVAEVATKP